MMFFNENQKKIIDAKQRYDNSILEEFKRNSPGTLTKKSNQPATKK
jgi:hypothetical protein